MTNGASDSPDPQLATLLGHSAVPAGIRDAIRKPAGARFFRCALQVNPFAYTTRHAKQTPFKNEEEYNAAIVAACLKEGIEVVGITDHFRIATSQKLAAALTVAGIHVLVGFEASSSEGGPARGDRLTQPVFDLSLIEAVHRSCRGRELR